MSPPDPTRRPAGDLDFTAAIRQWPQWWSRLLQAPDDRFIRPGAPAWEQLRDLEVVTTLAEQQNEAFQEWMNPTAREFGNSHRTEGVHVTHFVNSFEGRLGRPLRPFSLRLRALPPCKAGGWVVSDQQVIVSLSLLRDRAALETFLEPVIRWVA